MPQIRYYSTNRNLDQIGGQIRDQIGGLTPFKETVTFRDALLIGQAPDEGLFMPQSIPSLDLADITALKGKPYHEAALLIAQAYLSDDVPFETLKWVVEDAYNFVVPLEKVLDRKYVMRLDQGPTASFKDFAARMMARLMSVLRDPGSTAQRARRDIGRYGKRRGRGL